MSEEMGHRHGAATYYLVHSASELDPQDGAPHTHRRVKLSDVEDPAMTGWRRWQHWAAAALGAVMSRS
jgi:hypothetical protein